MRYTKILLLAFFLAAALNSITRAQVEDAPKDIQAYIDREAKKEKVPAEINKLIYGDLNGDGVKDAVVQYNILEGFPGNSFISYIAVFLKTKGKYIFAAKMDDGGKFSTVLVPASVKNKIIIFDKFDESGFKKTGTARYKLVGRKLVKV